MSDDAPVPYPLIPRSRLLAAAVFAVALGGLAAGAQALRQSSAAPAAAQTAPPPATPVMVSTVVQAEVATGGEFSGRLEAGERVDVRSRVAGAVQTVHFLEGALVRAGDLLVTIDPAPFAADVDRAQAQLVAAQARLTYTTSELERANRLWDESAIARRELDERIHARQEAD